MSLEHDAEAEESAPEEPLAETAGDTDTEKASVEPSEETVYSSLSRRGMLLSGGLLGLLGLGVGSASADASGQIGTATDPLNKLHTNELNGGITGDTALTSLTGDGLSISSGSLGADLGDGLTINGGAIVPELGDGLEITPFSQFEENPFTIRIKTGSGLRFFNGELEVFGVSISSLKTQGSDFTALQVTEESEFSEPGNTDVNIIGGKSISRDSGVLNAVVFGDNHTVGNSGGGDNKHITISGGKNCIASNKQTTIGGGSGNDAIGPSATIAGGVNNTAGFQCTVGGGQQNDTTNGVNATIAGGSSNTAGGSGAVAGGSSNTASKDGSFAVGRNCTAGGSDSVAMGRKADADGNNGAFVFSDNTDTTTTATAENEVRFQAGGGFVVEGDITATGSVNENSSARYKSNIRPLGRDRSPVLDLEPKKYEFKKSGDTDIGLIAEEVADVVPELVKYDQKDRPDAVNYARVGMFLAPEVSMNRDRLETVEAAREECEETIETLELELDAKDARVADQADRIDQLESAVENKSVLLESVRSVVDEKKARIDELEAENTKLETRLSAVEAELGFGGVTADASVADD